MGGSDVPVGQYTQKILAYYNLDEEALASAGTITYATNVMEVTSQVSAGSADCGVIYRPTPTPPAWPSSTPPQRTCAAAWSARLPPPKGRTQPRVPAPSWTSSQGRQATADFSRSAFTHWPTPRELTKDSPLSAFAAHPLAHGEKGRMDWYPLYNSVRIAAVSTLVVYFLGIFLANVWPAPRAWSSALDVVLTLPLVLPPTVVGYLLLRSLAPSAPLAPGCLRPSASSSRWSGTRPSSPPWW